MRVHAIFYNGEIKQYDMKQLFVVFPQFEKFQSIPELFERATVDTGGYGVSWDDELDLDAETIWEDGILIEVQKSSDVNHVLAYHLSLARENAHMTQKELSEKTGIYQADISKIERGLGNPSLLTLQRIANGLGLELQIAFAARKEESKSV
ncbi:MAG: helix-turn-helix domain-containing protein [Hespellia sp.]|nr:helix-turn-helix domain-containing protein [Hespellia sp.]